MYVQGVENVTDLKYNQDVRYGEVFHQNEREYSSSISKKADTEILFRHFRDAGKNVAL